MKKLRWRSILAGFAVLLILAGVTPLVYVMCWGYLHNPETLSVPILLKPGEYISPLFTTDLNDDYQIEIYDLPTRKMPLDIDWKVVDQAGALLDAGAYRENLQTGGNVAILDRHLRSTRRTRQRVILQIHRGLQQASSSDIRLHVGVPERSLQVAYGSAAAVIVMAILAGPGMAILVVLWIQHLLRRKTIGATAQ